MKRKGIQVVAWLNLSGGGTGCLALLRRASNDGGLVQRFYIQLLQSCTPGGSRNPPVSPEVIHIKPLTWLPITVRSSCRAFSPPGRFHLLHTFTPHASCLKAFCAVKPSRRHASYPTPSRLFPQTFLNLPIK